MSNLFKLSIKSLKKVVKNVADTGKAVIDIDNKLTEITAKELIAAEDELKKHVKKAIHVVDAAEDSYKVFEDNYNKAINDYCITRLYGEYF